MNLTNLDVRKAIESHRVKYYEVAEALGVSCSTFSHWLQREMSEEKKDKVFRAILSIKK